MQIWDFNLGEVRGNDKSNPVEVGYSANDVGLMMKSYGELLKEASLATTRGLEISGLNCSIVHEDVTAFNVSDIDLQKYLNFLKLFVYVFCCLIKGQRLCCYYLDGSLERAFL